MKIFVPLIVLCGFVASIQAQKSAKEATPTPTPERNRQIVALLNDARIAAPELAVDTFLKVVESKKVTDPVWRKEIIDEALRTIDEVQYAMPIHNSPARPGPRCVPPLPASTHGHEPDLG